ncbi:MAG: M56 family metallopeptidase, partial [Thermoguttaceae bacterium]
MNIAYQTLLANAIVAMVLAILVAAITRVVRHPPLAHFLWLLVLLKLVTPPLRSFEIPIPRTAAVVETSTATLSPVSQIARAATPCQEAAKQDQPVEFESARTGGEESGELAAVPAVLPPPVNLDLPFLAETRQSSQRPDTLDNRAGSLAPKVSWPERTPETVIMPTAPTASTRWSWESSLSVAGWVWLAGSALWFTVAALRVMRFERCRRQAEPAPASLQAEARRLARQLGLAHCPAIRVVQGRLPPLLWAMTGKATILLPALLLEQMPPSQQAMVVAHEMAHFARRDHWFRWLEVLVFGIYWWFPVAWWARRQLHHAAEQCCDAWVVWLFPNGAHCYARSLLETIDFLSRARAFSPVGASSLGQFHFHSLQRRFRMILSRSMTRRMPWSMRITAVLVGLAILSFSARCVWGQGALAKAPEAKADTPATAESKAEDLKTPAAATDNVPVTPTENKTQAANALPAAAGAPPTPAGLPTTPAVALPTPASAPTISVGTPPTPAGVPTIPEGALPTPASAPTTPAVALPMGGPPAVAGPTANSLPPGATPAPAGGIVGPFGQPGGQGSQSGNFMPQPTNVEQRLQRLEAVTNQILQELRSLRSQNSGGAFYRMPPSSTETWIRARNSRSAAQLSAVDEQIRALAVEMEAMKARMAQLQNARAKLAPQRPLELPRSTPRFPERDLRTPSVTAPPSPDMPE